MLPYMDKLPNMEGNLCSCEHECPYPSSPMVVPSVHNDRSKFLVCLSLALALNSIADCQLFLIGDIVFPCPSINSSKFRFLI